MGYQVGTACYGDAASAVSAIASGQVGALVQHGGAAYVVDATAVTGSSITYSLNPVDSGTALVVVAPVTAQPCGLLEWQDGLVIGWAVAGAWLATAAVLFLKRAAHE